MEIVGHGRRRWCSGGTAGAVMTRRKRAWGREGKRKGERENMMAGERIVRESLGVRGKGGDGVWLIKRDRRMPSRVRVYFLWEEEEMLEEENAKEIEGKNYFILFYFFPHYLLLGRGSC